MDGETVEVDELGGEPAPCYEDEDEEESFDVMSHPVTASCIHGIIARATDELAVEHQRESPRSGEGSEIEMYADSRSPSQSSSASPTARGALPDAVVASAVATTQSDGPLAAPPAEPATLAPGVAKRARADRRRCKPAPNEVLQAEIARVLAAPRHSADLRKYAASVDGGFGRVPVFLRPMAARLDAEQRYIISLREPREEKNPPQRVRLLGKGEKDALLLGLKQQFQRAIGHLQAERKKGGPKAHLQAEVSRIKKDLECLNKPYVFVAEGG